MKIAIITFSFIFSIFFLTSCGYDGQKSRAAGMQNQPAKENANTVIFHGKAAGIGFDEMTLPTKLCGSNEVSYARMPNKDLATQYNNLVNTYGERVWVKMKIIHPVWFNGKVTKFEIIGFGVTTKSEPAPCDCEEKEEVTPPAPPVIKEPTPVKEKPAVVKEEPTPVVKEIKKEIAAKDLQPCFKAKDYEVITIIKERGKVVSETTTNLGDVVDAGGPSLPDNGVDAGEN